MLPDPDPQEIIEWREAFEAAVASHGRERGAVLLDELVAVAQKLGLQWRGGLSSPYVNTVRVEDEPAFPGDVAIEDRLGSLMRWNALAMVARANAAYGELGGHIASYASAADLFEVGFNHFFRAPGETHGGDLVFFQPHSAPGVYARAFLEGRLDAGDLAHYRQELEGKDRGVRGLTSYPHPWLMPDFWQFPTGSMGLGPITSIYQARFMRYLEHRGLLDTAGRRVWGFFGDGEMDEPESMSALTLASREGLDNLTWVINCNLQRLDGPVRGNGRIIDELESHFAGAGWNVVKLVWGADWDALFARDRTGALVRAFSNTVDGQFQTFAANDGKFNREQFFGQSPALAALVQGWTDEQIDRLRRGGHDLVKIHAAYHAAINRKDVPTVVLAQTKKGFGMGSAGQGRMTTHSQKKLDREALLEFRDRFVLPLSDAQAENLEFVKPAADSAELKYLHARRAALGGYLPARRRDAPAVEVPALAKYASFALDSAGKEMSTTMAFVRMLTALLRDASLGPRVVPIVADEARTFGMANLFRQVGIYSNVGQRYEPEDVGSMMSYREARDGQILEEGISEAGALSSWIAAATSYSVHGLAMMPFYVFYSVFGFQRVGDLIWSAADQRSRGFLVGATSGRTTLAGEGLQHQDGSSLLVAATVPNCRAWDPAFAGELAVILDHGMREMLVERRDVFHYVAVTNDNRTQPSLPEDAHAGVVRGMYRFSSSGAKGQRVQLLGSGSILPEAIEAARILDGQGVAADVWSVTSWSELAREGMACEREGLAGGALREPWVRSQLAASDGPIIAATDYVRAVPDAIRAWLPQGRRYITLGTDGFGRSDTRKHLRRFFEVDAQSIAQAALHSLGRLAPAAAARFEPPPWQR